MLKLLNIKAKDKVNRLKFALLFLDQDAAIYGFDELWNRNINPIIYLN